MEHPPPGLYTEIREQIDIIETIVNVHGNKVSIHYLETSHY